MQKLHYIVESLPAVCFITMWNAEIVSAAYLWHGLVPLSVSR